MMQALNRRNEHSPIIVIAYDLLIVTIENLNKGRKEQKRKRIQEFRSGRPSLTAAAAAGK